jgi:hypothetical protein
MAEPKTGSGIRCIWYDRDLRQRCTLDQGHAGDHQYRPKDAGPMVGRIERTPSCKACGTAVAEGQKFCEVCAELPQYQAPKATVATSTQGVPPYVTKGNFRQVLPEPGE